MTVRLVDMPPAKAYLATSLWTVTKDGQRVDAQHGHHCRVALMVAKSCRRLTRSLLHRCELMADAGASGAGGASRSCCLQRAGVSLAQFLAPTRDFPRSRRHAPAIPRPNTSKTTLRSPAP